ncbi:MAG: hemolysin family protein [Oscillospiraceae bacterium]|nr:hemolysin family protein [Oscillospiraceae bacterium]
MVELTMLIILILFGAIFSMMEIAYISLNDAKISRMAKEGNKKAIRIGRTLKQPSKFLATVQIGSTLAGFLSSAFAANAFADDLAPILYRILPVNIHVATSISIILITIMLSYFAIVFGELVPKRIAMKYYERIAFATTGVIRGTYIITAPFAKILSVSTNVVSKIFGVSEHDEEVVTEEEIRMMVSVGQEKGSIEDEEKVLINNIFEFNDKVVSEVMIHRKDIYAVDLNSELVSVIDELKEYKYSRIPVYEENIDNIVGMLFIKDLLAVINKKGIENIKIKQIVREAYFVSEHKLINEVFKDLQKNKHHMAVVLDEYGGTAGVITMEDIIEEIVGNIFDEYDEVELEYEKIDDTTFLLSGGITIHELKKILEVDIPEGEYETLSGYLVDLLGRIPSEEEKPLIQTEMVNYQIEEYEERRILWVKAYKNITEDMLESEDADV